MKAKWIKGNYRIAGGNMSDDPVWASSLAGFHTKVFYSWETKFIHHELLT